MKKLIVLNITLSFLDVISSDTERQIALYNRPFYDKKTEHLIDAKIIVKNATKKIKL